MFTENKVNNLFVYKMLSLFCYKLTILMYNTPNGDDNT